MSVLGSVNDVAASGAARQSGPGSPNVPNDSLAANGPRPQQAAIPFWDNFDTALADGGKGSVSNNSFNPWDVCKLGGLVLPGLAKVTVKARKRFDVKKAKGKDGATLTFTGYDPSDVTIQLRIWTPVHLDTLYGQMNMLKAKATTAKGALVAAAESALDINHPATALVGIGSVVIESISSLVPTETKGVMQMEIHCLEFIKPPKGDTSNTTKQSQDFHNATAINPNAPRPAAQPPMPSTDATFTGPDGQAH